MGRGMTFGLFSFSLGAVALGKVDMDYGYERHIAIAGDSGMAVSWYSAEPYNTTSKVYFGLAPQLSQVVEGSMATTYYGSGYHHHVVLQNLSPSMTYSYAVGSGAGDWSDVHNFTTVPDSSATSLSFAFFGDLGAKDPWKHHGTSTIDYLVQNLFFQCWVFFTVCSYVVLLLSYTLID
jgi:hypothetical protein